MGDLFNTLNKSLPGRSSMPLEGQFLCCAVTLSVLAIAQLRCIRTFRKMFSCLRRSDRHESNGMGHVEAVQNLSKSLEEWNYDATQFLWPDRPAVLRDFDFLCWRLLFVLHSMKSHLGDSNNTYKKNLCVVESCFTSSFSPIPQLSQYHRPNPRSKSLSPCGLKTPQYRVRKCVHESKPRATNRSRVNPITSAV